MVALVQFGTLNKGLIDSYIAGRQMVATNTALGEFLDGVRRLAGPIEQINTDVLLPQIFPVLDLPSARFAALTPGGSLGANDIIIFGTGDQLGIETLTGDATAVNAVQSRGIRINQPGGFRVWIHPPARFKRL